MEPGENKNLTQPQEGTPNPNRQPININMEIDERIKCLRSIQKIYRVL